MRSRLQQENDLANELQGRIHDRGVELKDAGLDHASAAQIAVWNAIWVSLVSNLPDEGGHKHWA